ncbi:hypothetical protein JYU34_014556 [Plutella xylostella]|uniref:Uncharacterized protein n=1 Tax=Plutella xylostella TaxID=51655 RepID=A0ABQ7Q8K8_PLUXY|nr:hypothetical protein JYU34_014556 [Plutella xylostella]
MLQASASPRSAPREGERRGGLRHVRSPQPHACETSGRRERVRAPPAPRAPRRPAPLAPAPVRRRPPRVCPPVPCRAPLARV